MTNQMYFDTILEDFNEMQIKADYFQVNGMIRMAILTGVISIDQGRELKKIADKKLCELDRED